MAEQSKSLASAKRERTQLIAAFAAKNTVSSHGIFWQGAGKFYFARQAGGTVFRWLKTTLQRPPSLSLHRLPLYTSLCQGIWISSPESLWAEISCSGTTGPSHKDKLAEIFLKGWFPMEEAFPRTVNTPNSCPSHQESHFRKPWDSKADFSVSHVIAQHKAVQKCETTRQQNAGFESNM